MNFYTNFTKFFCLFLFVVILGYNTYSQMSGNINYNQNKTDKLVNPYTQAMINSGSEVDLHANVLINVVPDYYVAIFNVIQLAENLDFANQSMNSRITGFTEALSKTGIPAKNIYIDIISQVPVYEYEKDKKLFSKTYNEIPKYFELQRNVHVKFQDISNLNEIINSAAKNEIYDIVKVDCFTNEHEKYLDTLRTKAIDLIISKMNDYKRLNLQLEPVGKVAAEKSLVIYPVTRYSRYEAANTSNMPNTGSLKIITNRPVVNLYYDQLPYDNYDIVLHPVVNVPVIQFSYSIVMRYTVSKPVKEFYIVTPGGEIKEIVK